MMMLDLGWIVGIDNMVGMMMGVGVGRHFGGVAGGLCGGGGE